MGTKVKAKRRHSGLSPEEFVKRWQASASALEAAKRMGISYSGVISRCAGYRKKGVPLKRMPHTGRAPMSKGRIAALTALCKNGQAKK